MKKLHTFAPHFKQNAQMAESVDALVSNTSGAIRAGSIPALGTRKGTFFRRFLFYFTHFRYYPFPFTQHGTSENIRGSYGSYSYELRGVIV